MRSIHICGASAAIAIVPSSDIRAITHRDRRHDRARAGAKSAPLSTSHGADRRARADHRERIADHVADRERERSGAAQRATSPPPLIRDSAARSTLSSSIGAPASIAERTRAA